MFNQLREGHTNRNRILITLVIKNIGVQHFHPKLTGLLPISDLALGTLLTLVAIQLFAMYALSGLYSKLLTAVAFALSELELIYLCLLT